MSPRRSPRRATRTNHPAKRRVRDRSAADLEGASVRIPRDRDTVEARFGNKTIRLTNLRKVFWPDLAITKGDLLQFYLDMAHVLLPHLIDRPMVMKRYPNGADVGHGNRYVVHGHHADRLAPIAGKHKTNLDGLAWKTGRLVIGVFEDDRPGGASEYLEVFGREM